MLEIIAIIFLSGSMGRLASRKGQKVGLWRLYTVLAWIGAEILGIVLAILLFQTDEIFALLLMGYAFAIGSYFVLKAVLSKKPDVDAQAFEFEQNNNPQP
jgi:hypothetical protein